MSQNSREPSYKIRRPGGEIDPNRVFNAPGVVMALVIANLLVFAMMIFAPRHAAVIIEYVAAVSPQRFALGPEGNGGLLPMLSPLIGHMFVHAGFAHLLMNMFFLLAFGTPTARRMGAENALKSSGAFARASLFVTLYLLSGVCGALAYIAMHTNEPSLLVGASGGVSGLLGALVRFAFNRSTLFGPEEARLSPLFSSVVFTWTAVIVLMNVVFGIFGGAIADGANIAWEAHIGGYLFGLLAFPLFESLARVIR